MAYQSPLKEVKARFGSKEVLAEQLYDHLDRQYEDETDDEFKRRVKTMSNRKLLRLHATLEDVKERFGDKAGLIDAIMKLRYDGKPDEQYRGKLERYQLTRLVDMHRSLSRRS